MHISKLKNKIIVCFEQDELRNIFETAKKKELLDEIEKQKISFEDLQNSHTKMVELSSIISDKTSNDRDDHEIFVSIFVFVHFYKKGSEICFELKNTFNTNKDTITTLEELNNFRNDPPDFIIKSDDGFREFELKRYRRGLVTDEVFNFLKQKIEHYGNDLGNMNLLLVLQPFTNDISKLNFHELNLKMNTLNLEFQGQILILYNENNKDIVLNQVFPKVTTTRIPIQLPSSV